MAPHLSTMVTGIITGSSDDAHEIWADIEKQLSTGSKGDHMIAANEVCKVLWGDRGVTRLMATPATEAARPARVTIWSRTVKRKAS
jgi:hypothetical protein